jgi:hypothetical protein
MNINISDEKAGKNRAMVLRTEQPPMPKLLKN